MAFEACFITLTVRVACSVHQDSKEISTGKYQPHDLVKLGPGVVPVPEELVVVVLTDVEFKNAVPILLVTGA